MSLSSCTRNLSDHTAPADQLGSAAGVVPGGVTRQYYIAAERRLFAHIPLGASACNGGLEPLNGEGALRAFSNASLSTVGSRRFRATFFEYTDATFATRKVRPHIPFLTPWLTPRSLCHPLPSGLLTLAAHAPEMRQSI